MGWGGSRPGSGSKPRKHGVVLGMNGIKRDQSGPVLPDGPTKDELTALLVPPADMTSAEQRAWERFAALAIDRNTLIPATVPGFRELCTRAAQCEALDRLTGISNVLECLAILKERRGWGASLASSLKDFKLTAFGKAETTGVPAAAVNPFAKFG